MNNNLLKILGVSTLIFGGTAVGFFIGHKEGWKACDKEWHKDIEHELETRGEYYFKSSKEDLILKPI